MMRSPSRPTLGEPRRSGHNNRAPVNRVCVTSVDELPSNSRAFVNKLAVAEWHVVFRTFSTSTGVRERHDRRRTEIRLRRTTVVTAHRTTTSRHVARLERLAAFHSGQSKKARQNERRNLEPTLTQRRGATALGPSEQP